MQAQQNIESDSCKSQGSLIIDANRKDLEIRDKPLVVFRHSHAHKTHSFLLLFLSSSHFTVLV